MEQLHPEREVPTIAELKAVLRREFGVTPRNLEAGSRARLPQDDGTTTVNSLDWGENWERPDGTANDLDDTIEMSRVLRDIRAGRLSDPAFELDVYCYGGQEGSWDGYGLMGNVTLARDAEGSWWIG